MTDEEAKTIALTIYGESNETLGASLVSAVKAGYRKGLEEVKVKIVSIEDKHKWCWAIDEYMKWLDAKRKG